MDLSVELGAGDNDLELGSLSLTRLDIEMGAGDVTVDLTGDWKSDLDASLKAGIGRATLQFPRDVGVRINAQGGIGNINASGLKRDGNAYVNDAYGQSEVTLRIDIKAGIGEINLNG